MPYRQTTGYKPAGAGVVSLVGTLGLSASAKSFTTARKLWLAFDALRTVGNIGITLNYDNISNENLKNALDWYVRIDMLISLGDIGYNVYKSARNSTELKNGLAQAKKEINQARSANVDTRQLTEIEDALKARARQAGIDWDSLVEAGDAAYLSDLLRLPTPKVANHIADKLKDCGYTLEEIILINYRAALGTATTDEIAKMQKLVKQHFSIPSEGVRMKKILSLEDVEDFHIGVNAGTESKQVGGCVAIAEDFNIENAAQIFDDFRMEYMDSKFRRTKGFAVIEYDNPGNSGLVNAFESPIVKGYEIPQTQTGMLGSYDKIIPEYYQPRIDLPDGAVLKIFDENGLLKQLYNYDIKSLSWKIINQ